MITFPVSKILQQEMQLVARSRPDFKQIDVYQNSPTGPQLLATTAPGAPGLSSLSNTDSVASQPRAGISSAEITRDKSDYWLIRPRSPVLNTPDS